MAQRSCRSARAPWISSSSWWSIDRSITAVIEANRLLRLPAFFLAKGSGLASGQVPESLLAEEFFAKAMMQARQELLRLLEGKL